MLTPYGRDNAFLMLATGLCLMMLAFTPIGTILAAITIVLGLALIGFTMWFFRDPERPLTPEAADPAVIVAPSDGQVTEVFEVDSVEGLDGKCIQITIFLSPVNLHVNRYPASGEILEARYVPGKYLMAWEPKASEENERAIFILRTAAGTILYRQITGFLARRIVYDTRTGDQVRVGDRFGMMKFGSRMDVIVPATATINVRTGEKVVSNKTILARLNPSGAQS
ncbi:MAG: phosphatidylserine decarboxylase family protein [Ignavibacteriae bacterium]|nr:MAG: phosphatidylserine decarboxylase family protein [Ignavibacteriota bacterium]